MIIIPQDPSPWPKLPSERELLREEDRKWASGVNANMGSLQQEVLFDTRLF